MCVNGWDSKCQLQRRRRNEIAPALDESIFHKWVIKCLFSCCSICLGFTWFGKQQKVKKKMEKICLVIVCLSSQPKKTRIQSPYFFFSTNIKMKWHFVHNFNSFFSRKLRRRMKKYINRLHLIACPFSSDEKFTAFIRCFIFSFCFFFLLFFHFSASYKLWI